jgi:S-adenosylmethionine hydrolase
MRRPKPSGIITITTDYGLRDPYVGILKGVIHSIAPSAYIIDLVHNIDPFDIAGGAYIIASSYKEFPEGTVHMVVVDPGVGSSRRPIAIVTKRYYFVGPDNGVLTPAAESDGVEAAINLDRPEYYRKPVSHTFHGRDIFAPIAAYLAVGRDPIELGTPIDPGDLVRPPIEFTCSREKGRVRTRIIHIDRFGNVVAGCSHEDFEKDAGIQIGSSVIIRARSGESYRATYRESFSLVKPGEIVVYRGSLGYIEIGIYMGSLQRSAGLRRGDELSIEVVR